MTLDSGWQAMLLAFLESPKGIALNQFLAAREASGARIYPAKRDYFRALEVTPLDQVRVVILGQDPYHQVGQAHGLSFSVNPRMVIPPSLRNIFKELERDLSIPPATHGFLESWGRQGVLMLNTILSVEEGTPGAHKGRGWEALTDSIIAAINAKADPVVFMLWGSHAQNKADLVSGSHHAKLLSTHPSPLSAYRGFLGCGHFSKANRFLNDNGQKSIDWSLPNDPLQADLYQLTPSS